MASDRGRLVGDWPLPAEVALGRGRYRLWLESGETLSPYQRLWKGNCGDTGAKQARLELDSTQVRSTEIVLDEESAVLAASDAILLAAAGRGPVADLEPHLRWLRADAQPLRVAMPPGDLLAARIDGDDGRWREMALVQGARAAGSTPLRLQRPGRGSTDLAVELECATSCELGDRLGLRLTTVEGRAELPAFERRSEEGVLAAWFGIPAGRATLQLESDRWRLPSDGSLLLPSDGVEHLTFEVVPLPALTVLLDLPDRLRGAPIRVGVFEMPTGREARSATVEAATAEHRLDHVPAAPLEVRVVTDPFELKARADLSDGRDATVTIAASLCRVHGEVLLGDEATAATLTFKTRPSGEGLTVRAEAEGGFEAWLVSGRPYLVSIDLPGRGLPWVEPPIEVEGSDCPRDFELPGNRIQFEVTDRRTAQPIAGAEVLVENHETEGEGVTTSQRLATDERGEATAQPLRKGTLLTFARAAGYEASEPTERPIVGDEEEILSIALEPELAGAQVEIRSSSGTAALGAELWIDPMRGGAPQILRVDDQGRVELPESARGAPVLVRAPGQASALRTWNGEEAAIWRLEPPGPPLVARIVDSTDAPVAWATAAIWIDGAKLLGPALRWALGAQSADGEGILRLTSLPARTVELLVWPPDPQLFALGSSGALDSRRTSIPYPWPDLVRLESAR